MVLGHEGAGTVIEVGENEKTFRDLGFGAVAQLGERYAGSVEVRGSIPLSSTTIMNKKN